MKSVAVCCVAKGKVIKNGEEHNKNFKWFERKTKKFQWFE